MSSIVLKDRVKGFALRWSKLSPNFGIVAGLLFITAYSAEVLGEDLGVSKIGEAISDIVWAYFVCDLIVLFLASPSFGAFVRGNFLAIISTALPFLRVFRVFRLVLAIRAMHSLSTTRATSSAIVLIAALPLIWYLGAVSVLDFESANQLSSIKNLDDALWWSVSTLTTVGYGDIYPLTFGGRVVAACLMVSGVGLFSAAAGLIAGWVLKDKKLPAEKGSD